MDCCTGLMDGFNPQLVNVYESLCELIKFFNVEVTLEELDEMYETDRGTGDLAGEFTPKDNCRSRYNVRIMCRNYSIILESDNVI